MNFRTAAILGCVISFGAFSPVAVDAAIVKRAVQDGKDIKFYWWPKLAPLAGWHEDEEMSLQYGMAALAPDGGTFVKAETVLYARAPYRPRVPDWPTLASLIADDQADFRRNDPAIRIEQLDDLIDADGQHLKTFRFIPSGDGNWEAVSYGEEGDFYLVFTISSRTKPGFVSQLASFSSLVKSYAKGKDVN